MHRHTASLFACTSRSSIDHLHVCSMEILINNSIMHTNNVNPTMSQKPSACTVHIWNSIHPLDYETLRDRMSSWEVGQNLRLKKAILFKSVWVWVLILFQMPLDNACRHAFQDRETLFCNACLHATQIHFENCIPNFENTKSVMNKTALYCKHDKVRNMCHGAAWLCLTLQCT